MLEQAVKWIKGLYATVILFISDAMLVVVAKLMEVAVNAKDLDTTGEMKYYLFEQDYVEPDNAEVLRMMRAVNERTKQLLTEGRVGMIKRSDIPANPPNHSTLVAEVSHMLTHLENLIRGKENDKANIRDTYAKKIVEDGEWGKMKFPTTQDLHSVLEQAIKNEDMTDAERKEINAIINVEGTALLEEGGALLTEADIISSEKITKKSPKKSKSKLKTKSKSKAKTAAKSKGK